MVAPYLDFSVRKIPSHLTGLIETRARADGQVQRLSAMLADVQLQIDKAVETRNAADTILALELACLETKGIAPVRGWLGRYGKRGDQRSYLVQCLQAASADGVLTSDLYRLLQERFKLIFATPRERRKWTSHIRTALRRLQKEGLARSIDLTVPGGRSKVRWQWVGALPSSKASA